MRAALYARVSTEEQTEGYSLDAQIERCREHCGAQGWQVVFEYLDPGHSGRSAQRPQFEKMMEDAQAGLFDIVMVHKLDRFSRSLRDSIECLGKLAAYGVGFLSIQERFDYTTPVGRLQMHILAALGQWYSENLGEETRKGLYQRAREGLWLGNLSTGYCLGLCSTCEDRLCPNIGHEDKGDGRVPMVHPVDGEGVRQLFSLYATGRFSFDSVARELTGRGYQMKTRWGRRPWIGDTVKKAITSPVYLGYVTYKGQRFPGQHEAIISEELWTKCQEMRHRNRRKARTYSPKFRTYLFRGILICEGCGQAMTAQTNRVGIPYYCCKSYFKQIPCSAPRWGIHESMLEEQIGEVISALELPPDWQTRIEQFANAKEGGRDIERKKARLEEKMRRLKFLYLEAMIDRDGFRQGRMEIENALAGLQPSLAVKIEVSAEQLRTMRLAWENATREERNQIVATLFEAVYCDPASKSLVAVKPKASFLPLFQEIKTLKENERKFEIRYDQAMCSYLCPQRNSNPRYHLERVVS